MLLKKETGCINMREFQEYTLGDGKKHRVELKSGGGGGESSHP